MLFSLSWEAKEAFETGDPQVSCTRCHFVSGFVFFSRVAPREFFKMIQQWVLSTNNEVEKNITHLNEKVSASLELLGIRALYLAFTLFFDFHLARVQMCGTLVSLLTPSFRFELNCVFYMLAKGAEENSSKNNSKFSYTAHEHHFIVSSLARISFGITLIFPVQRAVLAASFLWFFFFLPGL